MYKYNEDAILEEIKRYIDSTYGGHYVSNDDKKVQTIDVWDMMGIAAPAAQSNVVKYATRYGKKHGYNKNDLLKIIHYTILLWHFTQDEQVEKDEDVKQ